MFEKGTKSETLSTITVQKTKGQVFNWQQRLSVVGANA